MNLQFSSLSSGNRSAKEMIADSTITDQRVAAFVETSPTKAVSRMSRKLCISGDKLQKKLSSLCEQAQLLCQTDRACINK
jgi:hypothetical protein